MARSRTLPVVALLLSLAAAGLWLLRWLFVSGQWVRPGVIDLARLRMPVTVAAIVAWVLVLGFYAMRVALQRRRIEAVRSVGQLQVAATVVLLVVTGAVVASDTTGTVISLGLVGFGITLALQRPILSVAGWATIFFGDMFREGDRIQVGDLEGDVIQVGLFATRIWEVGHPDSRSPGRPTGRIRAISNAVFVEQSVANATSDTAMVFDEFVVNIAYEADLDLAKRLLHDVGDQVLDPAAHARMAKRYERLTRGLRMEKHFPLEPSVIMELQASWIDLRLRYLVGARAAAEVQTRLADAWQQAIQLHGERLPNVYPRQQSQLIGPDGRPLRRSTAPAPAGGHSGTSEEA